MKKICKRLLLQSSFVINLHDVYFFTKIHGVHDVCFSKKAFYTPRINLGKKIYSYNKYILGIYLKYTKYTKYTKYIRYRYILYIRNILLKISLKFGTPFGRRSWKKWHVFDTLARQLEKLARLWHVGMFTGTLARKNEKLPRFWHVGRYGTHDTQFSKLDEQSDKFVWTRLFGSIANEKNSPFFGISLLFSIMKRKSRCRRWKAVYISKSK